MADEEKLPGEKSPDRRRRSECNDAVASDATTNKVTADDAEKNADDEKKSGVKNFFRIFRYADRLDRCLYAIAFTGAIAVGAALPLMTLVFGASTATFSNLASGQSGGAQAFTDRVDHLVLYFVYLFIARLVIGYVATLCICTAAARTTRALRKDFLEHTLRQEVWHFDKLSNGSIATQVTTNGDRVNQGIAEKLYVGVTGLSLFFSSYIVALAVQWKLALIVMSIVPANFLLVGCCLGFDAPLEAKIVRIYSRAAVIAQDAIGSIKTIHAFGAHQKTVKRYDEHLTEAHKIGFWKSPMYGVLFSASTFLVMSATALAFWEGHRLYESGEVENVGTIFTVVLSITLGATAVLSMIPTFSSITNASSAAAELFEVLDKKSLLDPLAPQGSSPDSCIGEIMIRDLHFAYPSRPASQVLQGLDLILPAGKTTALVGASGCGKSTLVGLLERWYEPSAGTILLDGLDISKYNTKWLRSNIRLVQQEPVLFTGTIFDNVTKGLVGAQRNLSHSDQMELVRSACISSNAHDFIERLPNGYFTQVGEGASMLSGGQRQRVAIARSIISDPKILLLDEATSALDPRAESIVQDALTRVSADKTTLIIAHKLATVKAADSIAVMIRGKVVEQGSHNELIKKDGLYAAMVRAQDLGSMGNEKEPRNNVPSEKDGFVPAKSSTISESHATPEEVQHENDHLVAGTAGLSLWRCVYSMLAAQSDLYLLYLVIAVSCIIGGGSYPAQAIILSRLIRVFSLTGADATKQANFYSLMFFVLALANLVSKFAIGWCANLMGQTITHRYRREMLDRMLLLDQDFFDRPENSSGALASRLSSVPAALQQLLSLNLGLIIELTANIISSSVVAIAFGWKLGLTVVFGGLSFIVAAGYTRIRLDQKLDVFTGEQFAASAGLASEAVTSIRTISSLTLEPLILQQYSDAMGGIVSKVIRSLVVTLIPYAVSQSIDFLVMALGFWYGSTLVARGEYNITQFFVIFLSVVFGGQGASQFFGYTTSITQAKMAANYFFWLRSLKADIVETDGNRDRGPSGADAVVGLEEVEFNYKQRIVSKVLRGISLDVKSGSYAAFVGPSGCGKSTLLSLIMRFYDPTSGRVTMNGEDIAAMSPSSYRNHMSLVQQEPPLYSGSVRENIALGLQHEPSDKEVLDACQQANALDFVTSLPEGLNTPCGTKGLQFSGGQRQRIAVARALIRQPRLLLLDEATSALDTQSERVVQKALDDAAAGRTTIAVAHRLSTIRHADVIFVMEDGRIVETGTHDELQQLRGRYFAMCLAQSLDQA